MGTITAMKNGRTMFVINGVHGKLYWAYSLTDESTDGRAKVRSRNPEEAKARLREEFKGWELALQILEVTDPELILERRVLDLPVLPKWISGRVALLGGTSKNFVFSCPFHVECGILNFEDAVNTLQMKEQFSFSYWRSFKFPLCRCLLASIVIKQYPNFTDAAHAVTPALGQGANLAFEDGLELALQLSSASDLRYVF